MTKSGEHRPWWEASVLCRGRTKNGRRCRRYKRKAYEISPGDLFIPFTCYIHRNQENEIRKRLGLRMEK